MYLAEDLIEYVQKQKLGYNSEYEIPPSAPSKLPLVASSRRQLLIFAERYAKDLALRWQRESLLPMRERNLDSVLL